MRKTAAREQRLKHLEERKKEKKKKKVARKKEAEKLGLDAPPKKIPRTLENTREPDETTVDPTDDEVQRDISSDEFASYFSGEREPKIAITTSPGAGTKVVEFAETMSRVLCNAELFFRRAYTLEQIVTFCRNREFTDLIVLNENRGTVSDVLLSHLPGLLPFFFFTPFSFSPLKRTGFFLFQRRTDGPFHAHEPRDAERYS